MAPFDHSGAVNLRVVIPRHATERGLVVTKRSTSRTGVTRIPASARTLSLLVVVPMLMVGAPGRAAAYPRLSACVLPDRAFTYVFDHNGDGGAWPADQRSKVKLGFEAWNAVREYNNTSLNSIVETTSVAADYRIQRVQSVADGEARVVCGANRVEFESSLGLTNIEGLARHEAGHLLGLSHSGESDNFVGGEVSSASPPAMATCTSFGISRPIRADDFASDLQKNGIATVKYMNDNEGWEQGALSWQTDTSYNLVSGSAWRGQYWAKWFPASNSSNIYNNFNFANHHGRTVDWQITFRTPGATSGYVRMWLDYRSVQYGAMGPGSCSYESGKDQNVRTSFGWFGANYKDCALAGVWATCTVPTQFALPQSYDAVDLRLRIFSAAKTSTGSYSPVDLDDAQVRLRS